MDHGLRPPLEQKWWHFLFSFVANRFTSGILHIWKMHFVNQAWETIHDLCWMIWWNGQLNSSQIRGSEKPWNKCRSGCRRTRDSMLLGKGIPIWHICDSGHGGKCWNKGNSNSYIVKDHPPVPGRQDSCRYVSAYPVDCKRDGRQTSTTFAWPRSQVWHTESCMCKLPHGAKVSGNCLQLYRNTPWIMSTGQKLLETWPEISMPLLMSNWEPPL